MYKKNNLRFSIFLFIILLIISFSMGCGTKNQSSSQNKVSPEVKGKYNVGNGFGGSNSDVTVTFSEAAPVAKDQLRVESPVKSTQTSDVNQNTPKATLTNRKVVMTGTMQIETNKYDKAVDGITKLVQQVGGYVENSNMSGNKAPNGDFLENRAANFVLRIPSAKFQYIMTSMGSLGTIINKTTNGEDVTYQFYDNEARLKTLRIKEERILDILKRTKIMEDVLSAESELQNTTYEIENLTGTQKKLSNLVEYSTLSINVREVLAVKKLVKKPATLGERISYSFKESMQLLVDIIKGTIVVFVAILPFAVIIFIILALLWYFLKYKKKP